MCGVNASQQALCDHGQPWRQSQSSATFTGSADQKPHSNQLRRNIANGAGAAILDSLRALDSDSSSTYTDRSSAP